MSKECVIMTTHFLNASMLERFSWLNETAGIPCYLFVDTTYNLPQISLRNYEQRNIFFFNIEDILNSEFKDNIIKYDTPKIVPGNMDAVLLYIWDKYNFNKFDYIWRIDNDIFFNGKWDRFFRVWIDRNYDLLFVKGSKNFEDDKRNSFFKYDKEYYWFNHHIENLEIDKMYKIFGAYFRISKEALDTLSILYKENKVRAHFEVAFPTLLKYHNNIPILNHYKEFKFYQMEKDEEIDYNDIDNDNYQFCDIFTKYSFSWLEDQIPKNIIYENNKLYHPVKIKI